MGRLQNRVTLITGGANGQGEAEARLFASEGASVYITDVAEKKGRALAEEITQEGKRAVFLPLDVSQDELWAQTVEEIVRKEGRIDVLVNNAGIARAAGLEETTDAVWEQVISINQKGVLLGMRHVVPVMKKQRQGSILNISSIAGLVGSRVGVAYGASKGAVRFMTKSAAMELAPFGIRVNCIIPGPIDTEMIRGLGNRRYDNIPLGRLGQPEDVAYGALYLASDEAAFVTGIDLVIDGGFTTGAFRSSRTIEEEA